MPTPIRPGDHAAALARVDALMNNVQPGTPEEAEYLGLLDLLDAMPEEQIAEPAAPICPDTGAARCIPAPDPGWAPSPWRAGEEERMDYRWPVGGTECVLWLTTKEWGSGGQWAAEAWLAGGPALLGRLWQWGRTGAGYPSPSAAMEAAEAWLADWIAGWAPGMICAVAPTPADLCDCAESLWPNSWISPFTGYLDCRDPDLSARVIHALHGALSEVCQ